MCVSHPAMKRLTIGHKKGVRIVSCSILKSGLRIA